MQLRVVTSSRTLLLTPTCWAATTNKETDVHIISDLQALTEAAWWIQERSSLLLVLAPQSDLGTPRAEMAGSRPSKLRTVPAEPGAMLAHRAVTVSRKAMVHAASVQAWEETRPADWARGEAMPCTATARSVPRSMQR